MVTKPRLPVGPQQVPLSDPVALVADNLWKLAQLRKVLARAQQVGVQVLVLKGAALLGWLYELHERPMLDVDILIQLQDAETFLQAIEGRGASIRWSLPNEPSNEFGCDVGGVQLDVHVAALNSAWLRHGVNLDEAGWWARAEPFSVLGQTAYRLSPLDQLFYLAAHTVLHHVDWSDAAIEDVRRLLQRVPLDWWRVPALARQQKVETALWLVLSSPPVRGLTPEPVLRQLRPGSPRCWMAVIASALWQRGETTFAPMLLLDRPGDMVRAGMARLLPPDVWLHTRYPEISGSATRRAWHAGRIWRRVLQRVAESGVQLWDALRHRRT